MTSTFITSVYFTWHLYLWHQCFSDIYIYDISVSDMTSTLMTSVYFPWYLYLWHQCFSDIYIHDISVSDMTSTLITSLYFTWYQMKTISSTNECRRKHSFHSRTVTFLQLYKKWWQYHHWFFCLCELKQEAWYVLLICYLHSV